MEPFTCEQFQNLLKKWLRNASTQWFAYGNLSEEQTKDIVNGARAIFNFSAISKEDLHCCRVVQLENQHRLDLDVVDKKNENSCILSYFQWGKNSSDLRKALTNKIVMQWLDQPTFEQLRTVECLGYVV